MDGHLSRFVTTIPDVAQHNEFPIRIIGRVNDEAYRFVRIGNSHGDVDRVCNPGGRLKRKG